MHVLRSAVRCRLETKLSWLRCSRAGQSQRILSEIAGSRFFPDLQRPVPSGTAVAKCPARRSSVQPYRPSLRILPCSCQPSLKITSSKKSLSKRLRVTLRAAPAQSLSRIAAPPKRGKRDPPRSASGLAGRQMWAKSGTRVASQGSFICASRRIILRRNV